MKTAIAHSEKPKRNFLLAMYVIGAMVTVTSYSIVVAINTIY